MKASNIQVAEEEFRILSYRPELRGVFEEFRSRALAEGNDSLVVSKLCLDTFQGQLLLFFYQGELVSISACEPSHYTGDPETAARICRYHILSSYRSKFLFCGFRMMREHCIWADEQGFRVVYFTHNVDNRALNALYQQRRKYGFGVDNAWFEDPTFKSFRIMTDRVFEVSPKSSLLQYVYARIAPGHIWEPPRCMRPIPPEYAARLNGGHW